MEEKEIIKILEKAIKNFDEGKNKAGVNVVRKFYSQLIEKRDEEIRQDNESYECLVKRLIIGTEISTSEIQRWTAKGYNWSLKMLERLQKEGKIEKITRKNKYKVLVGKTKEEYDAEKLQEFMSELRPYVEHSYVCPSLDNFICNNTEIMADVDEVETTKKVILSTLEEFKVKGASVQSVVFGPTVTKYNITILANTSPKKIISLSQDIAMALQVRSINIYPNYNINGICVEVPNKTRHAVYLGNMLNDDAIVKAKSSSLMFAMGKDTNNKNVYGDITKMVHLLVTGATGSGKSVFLNSLIFSLIYKYSPEELRLILIDPKQTEFVMYKDLPHLLINEIITDSKKAIRSLDWAMYEMNRRYSLFENLSRCGKYVTNIDQFNEQIAGAERLPKIVIIIDEFADLMETSKKAVESSIFNLAVKSRAAGIHIILATQRVSAAVLTGTIKANFPARISFRVMSEVDSRAILNQSGAQNLLGNGDFLYISPTNNVPTRVQCSFVSPKEISDAISFIKANNEAYYNDSVASEISTNTGDENNNDGVTDEEIDPLYIEALRLALKNDCISISFLQRKLCMGYGKAGRILEWMEEKGYISAFDGAKARRIYITKEEFESKYGPL